MNRSLGMTAKTVLGCTFSAIRVLLLISVFAYMLIEFVELTGQREVLRLTLFSMFLLLSNYLVSISKHKAVFGEGERAQSVFLLGMFAMAAAVLELVDLALDEALKGIDLTTMQKLYVSVSGLESMIGFIAVLMIYFTLDRLMVFMRSLIINLKSVEIP